MGTIVADRVIPDLGLRTPLVLTFANGSLLDSSDPALLSLFEPGASRQFSLMTIGAHPQARPRGGPAEERLVCGRVALGIGANLFYGGSCDAAAHGQFIDSGARVEVDSRPLPDRFAPPPPEDGPSLPEGFRSSDIYRRFFENSNEALCILDFDSQILLEVNPAFESLTGYGRDEAVGRLSVSHLVSPESAEALARRRPLSLAHPSDRLEIRLVTRDKRPRSVDMSLRMMQVAGRNLVIGAIRDLTEQKRLEGAARDKIEEIIKANSRMGILKEKLEKMQELTSQLFNIREESDILQAAAEFMRDRSKLGYQNVNFYLVGPEGLALTLSTGDAGNRTIPLDSDSELVRVLYGESRAIVEEDRIVMPLKGLEQNIGVMEVFVPPKEMETLTGSPAAVRTYQNVTQTLSNILGLSLENVRLYDRLLKQSILDPLTSTYNRRYLDAKLAEEMKRASRYKRPLSVLMVDINGFKNINDTMGHRQGDVVLQEIADILARSTREVDVVARYGGDEFVIVMPETGAEGARAKAAQLSEEIARTPYSNLAEGNKSIHLSCSIGAVGYDEETALRTPEDMVRKADERMYQDKRLKRKAGSP
jgi:diguanylate cyclase (GGDEF)-like protein/PAS domain S-box-containing protein